MAKSRGRGLIMAVATTDRRTATTDMDRFAERIVAEYISENKTPPTLAIVRSRLRDLSGRLKLDSVAMELASDKPTFRDGNGSRPYCYSTVTLTASMAKPENTYGNIAIS